MSEQKLLPSTNPRPTDASSAFNAVRDQQRAVAWTGDPSNETVAEETFTDLDNYLHNRPKKAPKGPQEDTFNDDLPVEQQTFIEDVSMDDLVAKWAEADDSKDKTASTAVQDEIERRLVADDKMSDELRLKLIDRLVAQKEALQNSNKEGSVDVEDNNVVSENTDVEPTETPYDAGTPPKFEQGEYNQQNAVNTEVGESGDKAFQDKSFKELVDDNPGIAEALLNSPQEPIETPYDAGTPPFYAGTPPKFDREEYDRANGNQASNNTETQTEDEDDDDGRFGFRDRNDDAANDDDFDFTRRGGNSVEQQNGKHFELDPDLEIELAEAKAAYIRLQASRRGLVFGRKNKQALEIAKNRYYAALDDAGIWIATKCRENGDSDEKIRLAGVEGEIAELKATTTAIYERQVAGSEKTGIRKKFYEKWASWGGELLPNGVRGLFSKQGQRISLDGFKGKSKKMLAMGAITSVPAFAAGVFGAAFLGAGTVGALAGVGAARGLNRNLLGTRFDRNSEDVRTIAKVQLDQQLAEDEARIRDLADRGGIIEARDMAQGIEDATARDISRNRKRTAKSALTGATLGAVGGLAVANILGFGGGGRPSTGGANNSAGSGSGAAEVAKPKTGGAVGSGINGGPKGGLPVQPEAPTEPIPSGSGAAVTEAATPNVGAGGGLPELVVTDSRLPWTHVTDVLNENGTPDIFAAVDKGAKMGINIVGRGRSLESVTWNGVTYTDNGHINAALDYIMTHEA